MAPISCADRAVNPSPGNDFLFLGIFLLISAQFLGGFFGTGGIRTVLGVLGIASLILYIGQRVILRRRLRQSRRADADQLEESE